MTPSLISLFHFATKRVSPKVRSFVTVLAMLTLAASRSQSAVAISAPGSGLTARVDEASGVYEVALHHPARRFAGHLAAPMTDAVVSRGSDTVGAYREIRFAWRDGATPMTGRIRLYNGKPLALFAEMCDAAVETPPAPFPDFTKLPADLHVFSYRQETFAPPQFEANDTSTPWLLFDGRANALVISPASHFMVASLFGDGRSRIASGMNNRLRNLPAGFTQQTLLAFGQGINRAWALWGCTLTALEGATRPGDDADDVLKYLGYWTDNGATYYYNYDTNLGYAGTLESLVERYRREQIPIHYLQLDSWWYYKSFNGPDGQPGGTKAPQLPEGEWNRYGGLLEYKAPPFLFTDGLAAFQKTIGLPLVTHNRWIDPASPYHQKYKISGLAAVDPRWWDHITDYLKSCGVATYEQDWLDRIYKYSPPFSSTPDTAEMFLDDMARACRERSLTMQYCMPYPCHFLQGSRYENLTTIRVSDDRFQPAHWNNFLYTSRLAAALGIWPWVDVFMSGETNNLLLATLSAGPVGIGDAIGRENKANLLKAVRADGVIVKPDAPIVPLDRSYLADARGIQSPLIAGTFTDHDGLKTGYVFAFNRSRTDDEEMRFAPADLGLSGPVYVYDWFAGAARHLTSSRLFSAALKPQAAAFYLVAPVGKSGIAFLGDRGKFVSTGSQRIASMRDTPGQLTVGVLFATNENSVVLHGYAARAPKVTAQNGGAGAVNYDAATRYFTVELKPDPASAPTDSGGDPVRRVTAIFR
ncbi:MAG: hypothetical protein KGJ60_00755 [Verrucomicrobiota bacterium]|nr:hypothetical protein [Verrucomicrobiota bacterium]